MKPHAFAFFACLFLSLASCATPSISKDNLIDVGVERGEGYRVETPFLRILPNSDATFHVFVDEDYAITSCSYSRSRLTPTDYGYQLTLMRVQYPMTVSLSVAFNTVVIEDPTSQESSSSIIDSSTFSSESSCSEEESSYSTSEFSSLSESSSANAPTTIKAPKDGPHIRAHAPNGFNYFHKEGYLQVGWNTQKDGSGEYLGFGWRYDRSVENLYATFLPITDESLFTFEEKEKSAQITGYSGTLSEVVLPSFYHGKKVTSIGKGAIKSDTLTSLILSPYIVTVEEGAIRSSSLTTLTFYDALSSINDHSLDCPNLQTIRINAIEAPCYSGTYWDAFQDKIDFLAANKDKKKIVLFSGSSTRYGFYSPAIQDSYPDYVVINMGVFAYFGIFQQLEIITSYMKEGDILLHSPEFDAIEYQFDLSHAFDHRFFYCLEAGYGELTRIDLRKTSGLFDAYQAYESGRKHAPRLSYDFYAYHYDDEDNYYEQLTYNEHGDMISPRPNTTFSGRISQPYLTYTLAALFDPYPGAVASLNTLYNGYMERYGIRVLFTFAPKNIHCLTNEEDYDSWHQIEVYLRENLIVPVIQSIENSLFETQYFYLIDNHLSNEGAMLRTLMVAQALGSFI